MKGDFTRSTFKKERHYNRVNMQQGRVQLDADWNEQNDIHSYHERTFLEDLVGKHGTLREDDGFRILSNFSFSWGDIPGANSASLRDFLRNNFGLLWITNELEFGKSGDGKTITISTSEGQGHNATIALETGKAILSIDGKREYSFLVTGTTAYTGDHYVIRRGSYYVGGILCENESDVDASLQPDLKMQNTKLGDIQNPALPVKPTSDTYYLAYLDAWDQHVTYLDDLEMQETALGDVDTATRTKTAWQVKLVSIDPKYVDNQCGMWENVIGSISNQTTGRMQARAKLTKEPKDKCDIYETAGYQKLENQLYRVEVHKSGNNTNATFKWSSNNGTVVAKILGFNPGQNKITIAKRGKDDSLDFGLNDWIEVTDDLHERLGIPGTLVKINDIIDDTTIVYYHDTILPGTTYSGAVLTADNFSQNPKVRKWDHIKEDPNKDPFKEGVLIKYSAGSDYIDLEWGVQIRLSTGYYHTGDYWFAPARTRTGKVEWPTTGGVPDEPLALPPAGVKHRYAPLAILLHKPDDKYEVKVDARNFFSSLAELVAIHYAGGDGQEALPDNELASPLRVAVTVGGMPVSQTPIGKTKVRFTIIAFPPDSPGQLKSLQNNQLSDASHKVDVLTNDDGIAECEWTLGDGMETQRVKAELYDECENNLNIPPIYFSATLPLSFYYVEGDGVEASVTAPIALGAGVRLGRNAVTSGYKVKFEIVSGGKLQPEDPVSLNDKGIASVDYLHDESNPRKQAKAVLLHDDENEVNLPPIYFNVDTLREATPARTGILELVIPKGDYTLPLVYGAFNHSPELLDVPPAVMLGYVKEESVEKKEVAYTEDHVIGDVFGGGKQILHFKPVEITRSQFNVELWIRRFDGLGYAIMPRPSAASDTAAESRITVATDKSVYSRGEVAIISGKVKRPTTQPLTIQVFNPAGVVSRTDKVVPAADGSHAYPLAIQGSLAIDGTYTVRVTQASASATTTFDVGEVRDTLLLRWWAIPANEQSRQKGEHKTLRKIEFDRPDYGVGDTMGVIVTDDSTDLDEVPIRVWSTSDPVGVEKYAVETSSGTGVFTIEVDTSRTAVSGAVIVKEDDTVFARYDYGGSRPAEDTAIIKTNATTVTMEAGPGNILVEMDHVSLAEDKITAHVTTAENPEGIPIVLTRVPGTDKYRANVKLDPAAGSVTVGSDSVPLAGLRPGSDLNVIFKPDPEQPKSLRTSVRVPG